MTRAGGSDNVWVRRVRRVACTWPGIGVTRGAALAAVYAVLWAVGGVVAMVVTGNPVGNGAAIGAFVLAAGVPVGVLGGALIGAVCSVVDMLGGRKASRRRIATAVICTIAAVPFVAMTVANDAAGVWAVFVGGPCALGLISLWLWPLPARTPAGT